MKANKALVLLLVTGAFCVVGNADTNEDYQTWYQQGVDYVKQGDLEGAKVSFSMALSYKPGDPNAQKGLRMTEERLNRAQSPETAATVAPEKKPKDWSVRVTAGLAPAVDELEVEGFTGSFDSGDGGRVEVVAVRRLWNKNNPDIGWSFGGGAFGAKHSGTTAVGNELDVTAFGVLFQGGFAAKTGKYVVWEAGPYLGLGLASVDAPALEAAGLELQDPATYAYLGLKGGVFVLLNESFELGLEVGIESFSSTVEVTDGFATSDMTVSGVGPRVAAVVSYKF
jgi:hypothetical protein